MDAKAGSRPHLRAPPESCDTHMHFYDRRYPLAQSALFRPPDATPAMYRAVQRRLGLERTIVVQPSAYGTDNRCTLEGIAALGLSVTRGIAVVDDKVTDRDLEVLTKSGICGARFHMLPGGAIPWDMLDTIAARVQSVGWMVQLQLDGRLLPDWEAQVLSWPGRIVIDHTGKFLEPVPIDHAAFRCLLRLMDSDRVWVKLSAPYEVSKVGAPYYDDVGRLARALVKAAPHRILWASNWPHPGREIVPDDAELLDLLIDWVEDEKLHERVLRDNPAELYGF